MVVDEIGRLELLAADLEAEISAAPEHMEGRLRVAAGKARLLASQKLAQFKGLCHKNMVSIAGVSSSGYCSLLFNFQYVIQNLYRIYIEGLTVSPD